MFRVEQMQISLSGIINLNILNLGKKQAFSEVQLCFTRLQWRDYVLAVLKRGPFEGNKKIPILLPQETI